MAIRFDRAGTALVAKWWQVSGTRPQVGIPVLMYHSVSEDPEPGLGPYYRLTTSPQRFRGQMQWLRDSGYRTVGIPDALAALDASPADALARFVVVSFDDGFRDFLTGAWPVLRSCGFTATMFLPTAFIGGHFNGRECLTWAEVRALRTQGVSFGAHTVNHRVLHGLAWTQIKQEVADSRARIEHELQDRVRLFAYPYAYPQEDARFLRRLRAELTEEGFVASATTMVGRLTPGDDPMAIKRLPVNDCDDEALFAAKLDGAYDWVGCVQATLRKVRHLRSPQGRA